MIQTAAFEVEYLDLRGQQVHLVDAGAEVEVDQKPNIIKVQLPQQPLAQQHLTTHHQVTLAQPLKKKAKVAKRYR